VLGGGVAASVDLLLDAIRDEVRQHVFTTSLEGIEIVPAELGTWAGAIGAAIHGAEQASARPVRTAAPREALAG
jgi:glucokinase